MSRPSRSNHLLERIRATNNREIQVYCELGIAIVIGGEGVSRTGRASKIIPGADGIQINEC